MDKELIAMCDVPEIQDKLMECKRGDMCCDPDTHEICVVVDLYDSERIDIISCDEGDRDNTHPTNMVFIPRMDDLLEWLGKSLSEIRFIGPITYKVTIEHSPIETDYSIHRDSNLTVALIKAYMHLSHNKTWDGKAWI